MWFTGFSISSILLPPSILHGLLHAHQRQWHWHDEQKLYWGLHFQLKISCTNYSGATFCIKLLGPGPKIRFPFRICFILKSLHSPARITENCFLFYQAGRLHINMGSSVLRQHALRVAMPHATVSSVVNVGDRYKTDTSVAPLRGCSPLCLLISITSPEDLKAASTTACGVYKGTVVGFAGQHSAGASAILFHLCNLFDIHIAPFLKLRHIR